MHQTDEKHTGTCLNCGASLQGAFCHQCGQKDEHRIEPLRHVILEVFHDVLHFDARFFQSVRLLFARPGLLTQEYVAGRRARHLPPFRLYVFTSFILFFVLALGDGRPHGAKGPKGDGGVRVVVGDEAVQVTGKGSEEAGGEEGKGETLPGVDAEGKAVATTLRPRNAVERGILHGARRAARDPEAFTDHFQHWVSRIMFLLLPAFALLLMALFGRPRRYFVEHFVFSLHFHSFVFAVFILQWALGRLHRIWLDVPAYLLTILIPVHLYFAFKRVYGGGRLKLLVKGALLTGAYGLLVGVGMLLALAATLAH